MNARRFGERKAYPILVKFARQLFQWGTSDDVCIAAALFLAIGLLDCCCLVRAGVFVSVE